MTSDRFHATGPGDPSGALMPDEIMLVAVRRHVMTLAATVLETLGFVAVAAMLGYLFEYSNVVRVITGVLFIVAVVRLLWVILAYIMERFVITDRRLILTSGVINRNTAIMPMTRITDFTYYKSLAGRILGYATFRVESAGQDQALGQVEFLPHPDALYQILMGILFSGARTDVGPLEESDDGDPPELPQQMLVEPAMGGGRAAPYSDYTDTPTGPISRVMINDALEYPKYDEDDDYPDGGDGTGTSDDSEPESGRRRRGSAELDDDHPEDPIHRRRSPRWARRSSPTDLR